LIFIFEEKRSLKTLQSLPKNAVFIDDKYEVIDLLLENDLEAVWINRKSDKKHHKAPTISKLSDLLIYLG